MRLQRFFKFRNVDVGDVLKVVFGRACVGKNRSVLLKHHHKAVFSKIKAAKNFCQSVKRNFYGSVSDKAACPVVGASCDSHNCGSDGGGEGVCNHDLAVSLCGGDIPAALSWVVAARHGAVKVCRVAAPLCSKVNLSDVGIAFCEAFADGTDFLFDRTFFVAQNLNFSGFVHE